MEKPENCIICYEKLLDEKPLECGHIVHMECIKKHFKPECVICRKRLNIQVEGKPPESNIEYTIQDYESDNDNENYESDMDTENEEAKEIEEDMDENEFFAQLEQASWKQKGYNYAEEDSDYDEENLEY